MKSVGEVGPVSGGRSWGCVVGVSEFTGGGSKYCIQLPLSLQGQNNGTSLVTANVIIDRLQNLSCSSEAAMHNVSFCLKTPVINSKERSLCKVDDCFVMRIWSGWYTLVEESEEELW